MVLEYSPTKLGDFLVNEGKYSIHGAYEYDHYVFLKFPTRIIPQKTSE